MLGVAGGDGTQAIVAAIAAERGIPYVCVPAGTRNHFALDLGVDRDDVVGAMDAVGVDGAIIVSTFNLYRYDPSYALEVYARYPDRFRVVKPIDPADPGREIARLESAGPKPVLRPYAAMEYAANLGSLVYFSPLDGGIVYTIAAQPRRRSRDELVEKWSWHAHQTAAGTLDPIADAANRSRYPVNLSQTFGRFRIASFGAIDLAVLVRHVDSSVYAMRLT